LKSSNKKSCSLFNFLHIHILHGNFRVREDIFWTVSNLSQFKKNQIIKKTTLFLSGPTHFPSSPADPRSPRVAHVCHPTPLFSSDRPPPLHPCRHLTPTSLVERTSTPPPSSFASRDRARPPLPSTFSSVLAQRSHRAASIWNSFPERPFELSSRSTPQAAPPPFPSAYCPPQDIGAHRILRRIIAADEHRHPVDAGPCR
jgi:hypothetical protein